jgi:hypothetical protein
VSASGNLAVITWSGNGVPDRQGVFLQRFDTGDDESVPPQAPNLVGFAQALADSGTQFFGAAWCPACTAQKEAFEDGAQFLPFVEITNPDRSINQIGLDNNITVTATDQQGRIMQRTFRVDLAADTSNGNPYLNDIGPVSSPIDTPAQIQLTATDVEDDSVFFDASRRGTVNYTFTLSPTGLLEVTPPAGFTGTAEILVSVGRATNVLNDNQLLTIEFG